jgi:hypothetical protein
MNTSFNFFSATTHQCITQNKNDLPKAGRQNKQFCTTVEERVRFENCNCRTLKTKNEQNECYSAARSAAGSEQD